MRPPTEAAYFRALEIAPNVDLRWVPTPVMTGRITNAIPAAISPYSIAVAPDSSLRKTLSFWRIKQTLTDAAPLGMSH
jgi:hypothetical protein